MKLSEYVYKRTYYFKYYNCYIRAATYPNFSGIFYYFNCVTKPNNRRLKSSHWTSIDSVNFGYFCFTKDDLKRIKSIRKLTPQELELVRELYVL